MYLLFLILYILNRHNYFNSKKMLVISPLLYIPPVQYLNSFLGGGILFRLGTTDLTV